MCPEMRETLITVEQMLVYYCYFTPVLLGLKQVKHTALHPYKQCQTIERLGDIETESVILRAL